MGLDLDEHHSCTVSILLVLYFQVKDGGAPGDWEPVHGSRHGQNIAKLFMATSNKVAVENLLVRIQSTDKQADGSLSLSVTYLVNQETQRAKITIPAGKGISRHVAYRAAVDLFHKRIPKGTEFRASGIITNSIYKISKGGKELAGLSTRMVVNQFDMEEPEAIDDELEAIPVKVFGEETAKDETVEKVMRALGKAKRAVAPPSESEAEEEPLIRHRRGGATVTPATPKPQSNAFVDITNTGATDKKKGPGRPRKRKIKTKNASDDNIAEQEEEQEDEQENLNE
ncbi:hypothetical protein EC968_009016 [Mortierella alpina]|nr:hypothetical protein EC968_009016 [Mortierella alpina]